MSSSTPNAVVLSGVHKTYGKGDGAVAALRDVSLEFSPGSFTAVMGPSGSGKSTFLHVAAGLDAPTRARHSSAASTSPGSRQTALTVLRRERVGFVFQAFNLMPSLTVQENIGLPGAPRQGTRSTATGCARSCSARGWATRLKHRPSQLSGGQQQRVAIARALVTRPDVLFADEPTGALDTTTGREVLELMRQVVDETAQTVVMVTHDPVAAAHADRVVFLADGRVAGFLDSPTPERVAERMTHLGS